MEDRRVLREDGGIARQGNGPPSWHVIVAGQDHRVVAQAGRQARTAGAPQICWAGALYYRENSIKSCAWQIAWVSQPCSQPSSLAAAGKLREEGEHVPAVVTVLGGSACLHLYWWQ